MRYVTYVLTPHSGYFDVGEERMRANGVIPEAILHVDELNDETVLYRMALDGSQVDLRKCFDDERSTVIDYEGVEADDRIVVQVHHEPSELTRALLDIYFDHAVLMDFPIEYVGPERRSLRVSQVGPDDEIQSLIEETRAVVDVEIEQLGSYEPSAGRLFADLTPRQREVLETAVDAGYYEVPREVTYEDVADRLDCSAGAVGQHLRRIESRLMRTVVTGGEELDSLAVDP